MSPAAETQQSHGLGVEVSLWSADLGALAAEVARLTPFADAFHVDASDTRFIPDALFFPDLLAALRPHTPVPFHVHVMAERATGLAVAFARAGADMVTVHAEADDTAEAIAEIRRYGARAGLALRLDTAVDSVAPHCRDIDAVLMIGTPLGTKGTSMDAGAPARIAGMRGMLETLDATGVRIVADGGIRADTAPTLAAAGADAVVAGSLLLGSDDLVATTRWLRGLRPASAAATS